MQTAGTTPPDRLRRSWRAMLNDVRSRLDLLSLSCESSDTISTDTEPTKTRDPHGSHRFLQSRDSDGASLIPRAAVTTTHSSSSRRQRPHTNAHAQHTHTAAARRSPSPRHSGIFCRPLVPISDVTLSTNTSQPTAAQAAHTHKQASQQEPEHDDFSHHETMAAEGLGQGSRGAPTTMRVKVMRLQGAQFSIDVPPTVRSSIPTHEIIQFFISSLMVAEPLLPQATVAQLREAIHSKTVCPS